MVFGYWFKAGGHLINGDLESAQKSNEKAIEVALDPVYAQCPKSTLGVAYFLADQLQEAEKILKSCLTFCEKRSIGQFSVTSQLYLAPIMIAKGHMQQGIDLMDNARKTLISNQRRMFYGISDYILGEVYSQIATGSKPSLAIMAKNIGFLAKNVPFATRKAEKHFNKAIELFKEIGVRGYLGQVYLSLGQLHKERRRTDQARQSILKAINIFKECEAEAYLKQANEVLDSLT